MLVSLLGSQVDTCSGNDCVSQSAIPNQKAPWSSKLYERFIGFEAGGSLGSFMSYRIWLPEPGVFE